MIGMNIKTLRQQKHVKQETLADYLGVSSQAVSKWETGTSDPDIALLPKLAAYFGVSIDELFEVPRAEQMERIQNMIYAERRIRPETFQRTVEYLERLLQADPKDVEALTMLAQVYNHRAHSDHENASYYAERALDCCDPPHAHDQWSTYLEANEAPCGDDWFDNRFSVIRFVEGYLEKHPKNRSALLTLCDCLLADRRYDEAERFMEQLKGDYTYLDYRGKLAFGRGQKEEALRLWEQAARAYPAVWQAQDNLGEGYRALGMYDKALEAFERSFSMQGEKPFTDGLFARAQVHEQIGDYAAAMEDYRRIIDCLRDKWGITDGEEVDFELREIERLKELSARRA